MDTFSEKTLQRYSLLLNFAKILGINSSLIFKTYNNFKLAPHEPQE